MPPSRRFAGKHGFTYFTGDHSSLPLRTCSMFCISNYLFGGKGMPIIWFRGAPETKLCQRSPADESPRYAFPGVDRFENDLIAYVLGFQWGKL